MARSSRLVTKPSGFTSGLSSNTTNTTPYTPSPSTDKPVTSATRVCIDVGYSNFVELIYACDADGFNSTIWRWKKAGNTYLPCSVASLDAEAGTIAAATPSSSYSDPDENDVLASTIIKVYGDPAVKITNPATNAAVASVLLDCQGAEVIEIAIECDGNTSGFDDATDANVMWSLI